MAEWVFEARTRTGEVRNGTMEAENAAVVEERLRAQQLNPIKVKKKPIEINISFGSPVSPKDLVVFTRQFSTMINAGLPLVQCINMLASQGDNKQFNEILRQIKHYVEQGGTFSEALRRHPKVFDPLFVNLVSAGEMGGILDSIMDRLAVYIEKRVKLRRQVLSALVYPVAIFMVALVVIAAMLKWIIPTFQEMFRDFGNEDGLPTLTRGVIAASEGFRDNGLIIFVLLIATILGISYSLRTVRGKRFWHGLILQIPLLGPVMRKIAVARFTRTLGTLLSSGVPILDAMNVVAKASGNVVIEKAITQTAEKVREGRTLAEPLLETKVFPSMVVQMIGVGEQAGAMDVMLNKIADFYEEEVDIAVSSLTSLLEPLMMVVIGGVVGTMLIAMYLPVFEIAGQVAQ